MTDFREELEALKRRRDELYRKRWGMEPVPDIVAASMDAQELKIEENFRRIEALILEVEKLTAERDRLKRGIETH